MNPLCWRFRRRLGGYQDEELSARRRARVEAHVAGCESCRQELASLGRLRSALAREPVDLPEPALAAFWPQVRTRLAAAEAAPRPVWRRLWGDVGDRPRLVLAPALAAAALATLAVLAPWQQRATQSPSVSRATGPATAAVGSAELDNVVIQSIETADAEAPVMVYSSPDSDVTVLWVFGLERTGV
jgi:anti-sigma factor RsiW